MLHDYVKNFTDQIENGRHDLSPILADVLEDDSLHGDQQTLDHLRSGEPVYLTQHEGKHFARKKDDIHDFLLSRHPRHMRNLYETDGPNQPLFHHSVMKALDENSNNSVDLTNALSNVNSASHRTKDHVVNNILTDLSHKLHKKVSAIPDITYYTEHRENRPNHYKWETHPDQVVNALHEYYNHQYSPSERHLNRDDIEDQVHAAWSVHHDKTPLDKQMKNWESLIDSEHDIQHKRLTRNTQDREYDRRFNRGPL
jgi:hypothetical protein